jgi:hypothetical protein
LSKFGGSNRRKNLLSYPAAQMRMIGIFAFIAVFYAAVNIYVSRASLVGFAEDLRKDVVTNEQAQHNIDIVLTQKRHALDIQLSVLTVLSLIMLCLATLVISHRVAGPIYHLRKYMSDVVAGRRAKTNMTFREHDFFQDVPSIFDAFQDKVWKDGEQAPSGTASDDAEA